MKGTSKTNCIIDASQVSASSETIKESDNEEDLSEDNESMGVLAKNRPNWSNWWTSESSLRDAEDAILSHLNLPYQTRYVNIGPVVGDEDIKVWTWSANENAEGIPLVLLHGLGSALGLWVLNLDDLSKSSSQPIFAIDIPGFGRSSRPNYDTNPEEAEEQLVRVIESWRSAMNLDTMILVGHSFGGFISFAYSLRHPKRVGHLICADPWGFNKKPASLTEIAHIPTHHRIIVNVLDRLPLNPLWSVRFLGPLGLGPRIIKKVRADLIRNFGAFMDDASKKVSDYIFHCNAQNPTGESAFFTLMSTFGWAKNPMYLRMDALDENIPLTLIYGSRSWVDHYPAEEIIKRRPSSFVDFHMLDAGHHVYAEEADKFNKILLKSSTLVSNRIKCENPDLSFLPSSQEQRADFNANILS